MRKVCADRVGAEASCTHHIHRYMFPSVQGPAKPGFDAAAEIVFSLQGEFPIDVHLMPGNLIDV